MNNKKKKIKRSSWSYNDTTPFLDILFNTLLGFVLLFMIAFLLINPPNSKGKIDPKAEVLVVLEWPSGNFDDLDLWMKVPSGKFVGFRSREQDFASLERDDLGIVNDVVQTENGPQVSQLNREVITLRSLVDGHYVVNIHYYRDNVYAIMGMEETVLPPFGAKVTIIQLNPVYRELGTFVVRMEKSGQEKTAVRFNVEKGKIQNFDQVEELFVGGTMAFDFGGEFGRDAVR